MQNFLNLRVFGSQIARIGRLFGQQRGNLEGEMKEERYHYTLARD